MIDREKASHALLSIARGASDIILRIYSSSDFAVEFKGPNDPVTKADKAANDFILGELAREFPNVPIVAEESDAAQFSGFEKEPAAFFVDPIDGTKEFIARTGDFCIMLGLAEKGRASLGVIFQPTTGIGYVGGEGIQAHKVEGTRTTPLHVTGIDELAKARVIISKSHRNARADAILAKLGAETYTPWGSAGMKSMRIARAEGDLYAHVGNYGKRWDSCAPEAIVRAAGGEMTNADGAPFDYADPDITNHRGVVCGNPMLHIEAVRILQAEARG